MPRRPRLFEPHLVYDVTIQTVDREFLLKPTPEIRNIVGASFFDRTAWWKQGGPSGRRSLEEFIKWAGHLSWGFPHARE